MHVNMASSNHSSIKQFEEHQQKNIITEITEIHDIAAITVSPTIQSLHRRMPQKQQLSMPSRDVLPEEESEITNTNGTVLKNTWMKARNQ